MSTQVTFHRLAAGEYRQAYQWYLVRSSEVAKRFRSAVDAAVSRVIAAEESHPPLISSYRWVRVGPFPYVLIFRRESPTSIMVIALAHVRRRPKYWRPPEGE